MRVLTLDAETYYSKEYSLRRMSTAAYVMDSRFHVHMWAIKDGASPSFLATHDEAKEFFASVDWSDTAVVGHNLMFDGFILTQRYGVRPRLWIDTLGMSRAVLGPVLPSFSLGKVGDHLGLGGKLDGGQALMDVMGVEVLSPAQFKTLGVYSLRDGDLTYDIFQALSESFPESEYEILDWTIRCYTEPCVRIDQAMVTEAIAKEVERKDNLLASVGLTQKELRSDATFAALIENLGVTPPRKISKRTGKEAYAFAKTDPGMIDLLDSEDDEVRLLAGARVGVKTSIVETRLNSLREHGQATGNRFACGIGFSGAHTHRFSAVSGGRKGGLNILNFPRKGDLSKVLVAPPGYVMCNADSSQIECRLAMWLAGEHEPLAYLGSGRDLYSAFASHVYGRPIDKEKDPGARFVGKVGVLSLGYGASALALQNMLRTQGRAMGLPREQWDQDEDFCVDVVQMFRRTYGGVPRLWRALDGVLAHMADGKEPPQPCKGVEFTPTGYVLPSGLTVNYTDLQATQGETASGRARVQYDYRRINRQSSGDRQRIYGANVLENVCQSLAREVIVADQMVEINRELRVVWQVYDSVVALVPEGHIDEFGAFITSVMSRAPAWSQGYDLSLPIACEVGFGKTYAEAKTNKWTGR